MMVQTIAGIRAARWRMHDVFGAGLVRGPRDARRPDGRVALRMNYGS